MVVDSTGARHAAKACVCGPFPPLWIRAGPWGLLSVLGQCRLGGTKLSWRLYSPKGPCCFAPVLGQQSSAGLSMEYSNHFGFISRALSGPGLGYLKARPLLQHLGLPLLFRHNQTACCKGQETAASSQAGPALWHLRLQDLNEPRSLRAAGHAQTSFLCCARPWPSRLFSVRNPSGEGGQGQLVHECSDPPLGSAEREPGWSSGHCGRERRAVHLVY